MTDRNIPCGSYETEEPFDYHDRRGIADEYRFSRIVNPERRPEIDEGEDAPEFDVRYGY